MGVGLTRNTMNPKSFKAHLSSINILSIQACGAPATFDGQQAPFLNV